MKRYVIVLALLAACSSKGPATAASTETVSTTSASAAACIDSDALLGYRDDAKANLAKMQKALGSLDLDSAVTQARLMASSTRSMADEVGDAAPDVQAHFLRAADSLDKAASALDHLDVSNALSYIRQGTREVGEGAAGITQAMYC